MNWKSLFQIIGFFFFIFGFVAIFLQITGVSLSFFLWMENWGAGIGFLLKILVIVLGILLFYFARFDWQKEIEDSQ